MNKILLVEDDKNFGMVLKNYLEMNELDVKWEKDGKAGYERMIRENFDLCILDVMMPEMDGFSMAQKISEKDSSTPLIFLTARAQKSDILKGYRSGAIDYLTKPFDPEVLLHKIKAITLQTQRVSKNDEPEEIRFLEYTFKPALRRIFKSDELTFELSPKESKLLSILLQNRNKLMSREEILIPIWNENTYFSARSMDVYINKLRKRFKQDSNLKISNVRGEGFILELADQAEYSSEP